MFGFALHPPILISSSFFPFSSYWKPSHRKWSCSQSALRFRSMAAAGQSRAAQLFSSAANSSSSWGIPAGSRWLSMKFHPSGVSWVCPEVSSLPAILREAQEGEVCSVRRASLWRKPVCMWMLLLLPPRVNMQERRILKCTTHNIFNYLYCL